ncbi:Fructosamine-3-kinase [Actinobaculum suis]|uniref:Fructosamine kinase family protein n=1 Tax=Actinobaculum suis TaxID=1657 RepID=A0A1G7D0U6_9ACTO|nr:fructosamine kinase family protein [Actinobaculum suis]MDY5152813.1 fructosamine kinase family protein [Actinobaculum suis]SDE45149.1 Fructosamine-3-kinase [Actinobaculum suis]
MASFTKTGSPQEILGEYAGLQDLGAAAKAGGAPTVRVTSTVEDARERGFLAEPRLVSARATPAAAREFGKRLAYTHAYTGDLAPGEERPYGRAPSLVAGPQAPAFALGTSRLVTVPASHPQRTWGEFYASDRIEAFIPAAERNGCLSPSDIAVIEKLCERLRAGEFDAGEPALVTRGAALTHGDLWGGNVLWVSAESARTGAHGAESATGVTAVLIDPLSHAGAAETDLACLTVFGAPHVSDIYAGYNSVSPLAPGWEDRIGLHRMYMLMMHCALFGGSYGPQTVSQARVYA